MKKRSLLFAAAIMLAGSAAHAQWTYTTNADNTLTITGYSGYSGGVTIPGTINGLPVTIIGPSVFLDHFSLTSVSIPSGVKSIGNQAFYGCGLTNVTIPNSVTNIGNQTFFACDLVSITIPDSVSNIADYAFQNTTSLRAVYFQGNAPGGDSTVFLDDGNASAYYLAGTTGWGTKFAGIPAVELNGFNFIANTTNGVGPLTVSFAAAGLDSSGNAISSWNWTFGDGSTDTNQNPSHTYTNLGTYYPALVATNSLGVMVSGSGPAAISVVPPFNYTTNGGAVTITGYIGSGGAVIIPGTINGLPVTSIGYEAFSDSGVTSITITNSLTSIGVEAFNDCSSLTNLTLGGSLASIGEEAFASCSGLTSLTIPNGVTNIGSSAFWECTGLKAAYFQGNAPSGGSSVFYGDTNVTAYYMAGTTGWGATFGGVPAVELNGVVFTASSTNGMAALTVNFTAAGADGAGNAVSSWSWTFGDGATSTAQNPSHTYSNVATFHPALFATNSLGATDYGYGPATVSVKTPLNYTTNNGTITISGNAGSGGAVFIPGTIYGVPVTAIGSEAFFDDTRITSVIIAYGVTNIGQEAFFGCSGLTNVSIPNSVTSIGNEAFNVGGIAGPPPTYNLTNISIPSSATNIGQWAFACCGFTNVTIPAGVTTIAEGVFAFCINLTNVTIPNGVTSIGANAFESCSSLTNVTIADSVTNIGEEAFGWCAHLASVVFGSNLTTIGDDAFVDCLDLANATLPDSVTTICDDAFYNCSGLTNVTIPGSVTTIGGDAFADCSSLSGISISSNVTSIGGGAFNGCSRLAAINVDANNGVYMSLDGVLFNKNQTVLLEYPAGNGATFYSIPNGVTNIGGAFNQCGNLTNVFIPSSVIGMGDGPFAFCGGLTAINVDANNPAYVSVGGVLFNISQSVLIEFPGGNGAGSYAIQNSVTSIGNNAFEGCGNLTNVTIPNGAGSIGSGAFQDCANLAGIVIPNSVTSIGTSTFYGCSKLASVTIPMGVTSIGVNAFELCSSLRSVTIPGSVTNIGSFGFFFCTSLTAVYFEGNAPSADSTVFAPENPTAYYLAGTTGWSGFASSADVTTAVINGNTITATPTNGIAPLTVNFTSAGVDSGGNTISSWNWSFGDGAGSGVQNPSHNYNTPGTYYVLLFATNNSGATVLGVGPQVITVSMLAPCITGLNCCGSDLVLGGSNGLSGATYYVYTSADLSLPLSQWTLVATNALSAPGSFTITLTNSLNPATPQQYYILQTH